MNVLGKNGLGDVLKKFLKICFYIGNIILLFIPFILQFLNISIRDSVIIVYPNGIVLLIIMYNFIKLFDSLKNNNPFNIENVYTLKYLSTVSIIGASFWFLDFLYELFIVHTDNTITFIALLFLFILFFGVSIALYILSQLFKQAFEYKKENDLTI